MIICGQKERCKKEGTKNILTNIKHTNTLTCVTNGLQLEDILSVKLVEMGGAGLSKGVMCVSTSHLLDKRFN